MARFRMMEVAFSASGAYWISKPFCLQVLAPAAGPRSPSRRRSAPCACAPAPPASRAGSPSGGESSTAPSSWSSLAWAASSSARAVAQQQGPPARSPDPAAGPPPAGRGPRRPAAPAPPASSAARANGSRPEHHLVAGRLQGHAGHLEEELAVGADEDLHDIDIGAKRADRLHIAPSCCCVPDRPIIDGPCPRPGDDAGVRPAAPAGAGQEAWFFCLRLLGGRYAFEAPLVTEVVRLGPLTRLPAAPSFLPGVFTHRGEVLPVLDIGQLVGQGAIAIRASHPRRHRPLRPVEGGGDLRRRGGAGGAPAPRASSRRRPRAPAWPSSSPAWRATSTARWPSSTCRGWSRPPAARAVPGGERRRVTGPSASSCMFQVGARVFASTVGDVVRIGNVPRRPAPRSWSRRPAWAPPSPASAASWWPTTEGGASRTLVVDQVLGVRTVAERGAPAAPRLRRRRAPLRRRHRPGAAATTPPPCSSISPP